MIYKLLSSPAQGPVLKPVKRLYDSVMVFLENNERSQLTHTDGWKHNVEDIYIHYFESYSFEREKIPRQTWRKYKES